MLEVEGDKMQQKLPGRHSLPLGLWDQMPPSLLGVGVDISGGVGVVDISGGVGEPNMAKALIDGSNCW